MQLGENVMLKVLRNMCLVAAIFVFITNSATADQVVVVPLGTTVNIDAPIPWKGQWRVGTYYTTGDAVQHNGSSYICIKPHIAG